MSLITALTAAAFRGETSGKPEVVEAVLVEPEVVGDLVEHGDPDLLLELGRVGKRLDERQPEDRIRSGSAPAQSPRSGSGTPS
jgi:hypothetical protein